MENVARRTLQKARFFAEQAERAKASNRAAFEANLEAAIVFGRSVTFHLQKEGAHREGFEAWYASLQTLLQKDALSRFFLDKRNFILKEGPADIRKIISAEVRITVGLYGSADVRVIRGQP